MRADGADARDGLDTVEKEEAARGKTGFIFQNPQHQMILPILAEDIAFGLKNRGLPAAEITRLTDAVLHRFGISHLARRRVHELSGGEKQRLSIARALLRQPDILVFDEATSSLDSITEEEITETIRDVSAIKNQITILIAHRLSTIMHADKIFVLERGHIIESGKHRELLQEKGLYYAMWRQQIGEAFDNVGKITD